MASFIANMFPGGKQEKLEPTLIPSTPVKNTFTEPIQTPVGSPSKKTQPPGANELPTAFDNAMKLTSNIGLESPVKLGRSQNVISPLSPAKGNILAAEEGSPIVDDSIIHKSAIAGGSPVRKQEQENTPPALGRTKTTEQVTQHNHAAVSRQELYQTRDSRPTTPAAKKFNTSRGLTPEELEILQKPNVKRLVNVTQLCRLLDAGRWALDTLTRIG
jgi:cell cycle protein kinase DBF2